MIKSSRIIKKNKAINALYLPFTCVCEHRFKALIAEFHRQSGTSKILVNHKIIITLFLKNCKVIIKNDQGVERIASNYSELDQNNTSY